MPISVVCDSCGHTLKAPDNSAGRRGKCPRCGEAILVPLAGEIPEAVPVAMAIPADPYFPAVQAAPHARAPAEGGDSVRPVLAMVSGKPAHVWGGTIVPASFGKTILWLHEARVVEKKRRPVVRRDCELLISSIDSAQIAVSGNPLWIVLGFMTLPIFVGLIFFVLYFFLKHKFLVIHSHSNALVVTIKGDDAPYRDFLSATLDAAERHRIATAL